MTLDELKKETDIINQIDWDLTPEDAIGLYLEWGGNWRPGGVPYVIRGKQDISYYFVVNTWDDPPKIYLMKRSIEEAVELFEHPLTGEDKERFLKSVGNINGVYALDDELKKWLQNELLN
ncbi:MAG: hypothetical protein CSB21_02165 [Deltaproteobacteria bacterium]|nr:MAG: hypothetical protein CSB21_02165 [Deltaproteobacteria bacterium]